MERSSDSNTPEWLLQFVCLPLFLLLGIVPSIGAEKPNILLIVSEDNGPELGCYDDPYVKTPVLDDLAANGVRFNRAYVPQAGCSQSRAALLTGLYPHQNGQIGLATWKFALYDENTPNLVRCLKEAGYRTGNIGKLHVNPESAFPFDFKAIPSANFGRKNLDQYAKRAKEFIEDSDEPFFLCVNYPDAHRPFTPQAGRMPSNPLTAKDVKPLTYFGLDNAELREQTANYYNCINRLDSQVGDLIGALRNSGKLDKTLIIYLGDHGADMLRGKRTSYEGGIRIPLIVSWPGRLQNGVVKEELVSTLDLMPTILAAAEAKPVSELAGKSLLPLLDGQELEWRKYLFTEYHTHSAHNYFPQRTIRDYRFKLIQNLMPKTVNPGYAFTNGRFFDDLESTIAAAPEPIRSAYQLMERPPEIELYDLENDPYEFHNLSASPSHTSKLSELQSELLSWRKRTKDPFLHPKNITRLKAEIQACFQNGDPEKKRLQLNYQKYFFQAQTDANKAAKNILFIAIDDLRPALGCYGDKTAISPNIDRLAKGGTVFNRAYCQQAVCSPSRLSLMTGRRPDTTKVWDLYNRDEIPDANPKGAPELATRSWNELEGYTDIPADGKISTEKVKELRHGYYACVSYVDELVGRLLQKLKQVGLEEDTVVCLFGHHEFHLGEQGLWTKANNYELSNRVPLIIRIPGQTNRGSNTDALVELVDIYPTLVEACGFSIPPRLEGTSLLPIIDQPGKKWKFAVFSQYPRAFKGNRHKRAGDIMGYAVRTDRYRYIKWSEAESGRVVDHELYDHASDPNEMVNIARDLAQQKTVRSLQQTLDRGWKSALPKSAKPNVLFLAVDDMKDWVNCLGGYEGTVHTPNIDRLAARGTLFTNAHCPSPKCAPSRAAILTGLMPSTTGLYDNGHWWYPNLPDVVTLPAHFRNHGYHVAGAGKIFHHTAGNHPPNQWDDFRKLVFRDDPWFRGVKLNYPWSITGPKPDGSPFSGVPDLGHENDWGSLGYDEPDYDDSRSAKYAVQFLSTSQDRPFFLACGLFRPHLPWYVPQKYFDRYPPEQVVLPRVKENDLDDIPPPGRAFAKARQRDFHTIQKTGKYREAVRAYLASITYADAQLGRVLNALDRSDHAENTIVVFLSDHGWHLGEKGHWHKSTLWEEATRVPFIILAPGAAPGQCNRPVSLIDLYPTLNELCNLPTIDQHDGASLVSLLKDPIAKRDRPAIIQFKPGNVAVRSERFRYIRYREGSEEFYDLQSDPYEWTNLADDLNFSDAIQALAKKATTEWADPAPTKSAFSFDPDTFTWKVKSSGRVINGSAVTK